MQGRQNPGRCRDLAACLATTVETWLGAEPDAQEKSGDDPEKQRVAKRAADRYALDFKLLNGTLTYDLIQHFMTELFDGDSAAFGSYAIGTASTFARNAKRSESIDAARTANCPVVVAAPDTKFSTIASVAGKPVVRIQLPGASYYYMPLLDNNAYPLNKWVHTAISNIFEGNKDQDKVAEGRVGQWLQTTFGIDPVDFRTVEGLADTLLCNYKNKIGLAQKRSDLISPENESVDKISRTKREETNVNVWQISELRNDGRNTAVDKTSNIQTYVTQWNGLLTHSAKADKSLQQYATPGLLNYYAKALTKVATKYPNVDGLMTKLMATLASMCGPGEMVDLNKLKNIDTQANLHNPLRLGYFLCDVFIPSVIQRISDIPTDVTKNFCLINQWTNARFPYFIRTAVDKMACVDAQAALLTGDEGQRDRQLEVRYRNDLNNVIELQFDSCFDTVFDSLPSTASYMGISNNLVAKRGTLVTSFGYSGVGKTATLFKSEKSIMKSVINCAVVNDPNVSTKAFCTVSEIYGLRLGPREAAVRFYYNQHEKRTTEQYVHTFISDFMIAIPLLFNTAEDLRKNPGYPTATEHGTVYYQDGSFKGTQSTKNNPESSRSVMITTMKFSEAAKNSDGAEQGAIETKPLIVVDLPGMENVADTHSWDMLGNDTRPKHRLLPNNNTYYTEDGDGDDDNVNDGDDDDDGDGDGDDGVDDGGDSAPAEFTLSEIMCAMHDIACGEKAGHQGLLSLDPDRLKVIRKAFKAAIGTDVMVRIVGGPTGTDNYNNIESIYGDKWLKNNTSFSIFYEGPPELMESFLLLPEIEAFLSRIVTTDKENPIQQNQNQRYPKKLLRNTTDLTPKVPLTKRPPEVQQPVPAGGKKAAAAQAAATQRVQQQNSDEKWLKERFQELVKMRQIVFNGGKVYLNSPSVIFSNSGLIDGDGVNEVLSNAMRPDGKGMFHFSAILSRRRHGEAKSQRDMLFMANKDLKTKIGYYNEVELTDSVHTDVSGNFVDERNPNRIEAPFKPVAGLNTPADGEPRLRVMTYHARSIVAIGDFLAPIDQFIRSNTSIKPYIVFGQTHYDSNRNTTKGEKLHNLDNSNISQVFYVTAKEGRKRAEETSSLKDLDASVRLVVEQGFDTISRLLNAGNGREAVSEEQITSVVEYMVNKCTRIKWPQNMSSKPSYQREALGTMEGLFINKTLHDVFAFMRTKFVPQKNDEETEPDEQPTRELGQVEKLFMQGDINEYVNYFVFANRDTNTLGKDVFTRQLQGLKDNKANYEKVNVKYNSGAPWQAHHRALGG